MSHPYDDLLKLSDSDGDSLVLQEEYGTPGSRVYFHNPSDNGVFLTTSQIKQLRKVLKQWLIDNGHKEAA